MSWKIFGGKTSTYLLEKYGKSGMTKLGLQTSDATSFFFFITLKPRVG